MKRQFVYLATCWILVTVKGDHIIQRDISLRTQLYSDVFVLKTGVDRLQMLMQSLNESFSSQVKKLNELDSRLGVYNRQNYTCGNTPNILTDAVQDRQQLEDRMFTKMQFVQEREKRSLSKLQLTVDKLSNQMHRFDILENYLREQRLEFQTFMQIQTNMLRDLTKTIQQLKYNELDSELLRPSDWMHLEP